MDPCRPSADWRSDEDYADLARGDRHAFAWEWLRRLPAYRAACIRDAAGHGEAAAFGLHRFEPFDRPFPRARPLWRREIDPHVVMASARPHKPGKAAFDFAQLTELASSCHVVSGDAEHWLWTEGRRSLRLDLAAGTLRDGPVRLEYQLSGFQDVLPRLAAIERLVALTRSGRLVRGLFTKERRAPRWALVLRTWDALAAGATQREIADRLFDLGGLARWRIEASSWRQRTQRLVAAARASANVPPSRWLDGSWN
ncbi:MAG: DUF2285 domain-containing protein [Sphingomonadales bacterium]|nr:MAG: DUF2285 domain-containing protein [Sphingomonadales bacterium]